jgi:hypothetical protein
MDELAALVEQVPDEILDYIEDLEARVEKAETALGETPTAGEGDTIEKALDGLSEEVKKSFIEQRDRLVKAEAALETERVAKADAEWTAKVRPLDGVIDNPEEFGAELRTLAESNPEMANSIVTKLQTANERLTKSDLFNELGRGGGAPTGVEEKIQTIAKSLVEADPGKSRVDAEAEAWELNPDLYDEYVVERQTALRGGN